MNENQISYNRKELNPFFLPGKTEEELEEIFIELSEPRYRARQAFRRLNLHLASNIDEFTEFSLDLRNKLKEKGALNPSEITNSVISSDGTEKIILDTFEDGKTHHIETVWLLSGKRRTVCISSQAGCSYNCTFCATGTLPFDGNLTTAQILAQVYQFIRKRKELPSNIVFMGMGEPMHNYDAVMKAADILHHPQGLNISARHITISTAGVIPGIERMIREKKPYNLAISLNHTNSDGRKKIMDVEERFPLPRLLETLKKYVSNTGKEVTFEYVLIPGVNMSKDDVNRLIKITRMIKSKVNLIPLNTSLHGMRPPSDDDVLDFQDALLNARVKAFNRGFAGRDINGACGMLALNQKAI